MARRGDEYEVAMKRICVFCGSGAGARPVYMNAARELGNELARRGIGLVYGGAKIGLMGEVARAVIAGGAEVIGVIPQSMVRKEVAFMELGDLRIVGSMHERKASMADLADGFIALPGGLGTLEEFCEIMTWGQLDPSEALRAAEHRKLLRPATRVSRPRRRRRFHQTCPSRIGYS